LLGLAFDAISSDHIPTPFENAFKQKLIDDESFSFFMSINESKM